MKRELNVLIEKDEEGWLVGSVPELPGCHAQAHSLDELIERITEAAELCLEVSGDEIGNLEFVGVQRIAVEV
ncbi:MAG TPA: type II toxin-antitoxin system HicB family antitoxin [Candidatus Kapabacteria bacterium]|nr:type II toxin-antitoxin system HicB family antitoxin [Candidatus Kapabacteria bacterium]